MAIQASAARDIPQASSNRDNLTVVADRSVPATVARPLDLPTPPNSISPGLPAHGLKAQLQKAKLEPIESDLELHDSASKRSKRSKRSVSPAHDASGAITYNMLAKHHLPEILLNHGPLAIRFIMGHLMVTVPGFSGIPENKARRLITGALEGKGGRGGLHGDVEYEKVGWGRWSAKQKSSAKERKASLDAASYLSGIPISGLREDRLRVHDNDSFRFSHEDDNHMMPDVADNMSMDDEGTASCSEAPDDDVVMNDDPDDATDDEDWAAMGAAALRAESYPKETGEDGIRHVAEGTAALAAVSWPEKTHLAQAQAPVAGARSFRSHFFSRADLSSVNIDALAQSSNVQEREAVEALLRLGSV